MKVLFFGSRGWIGKQFCKYLIDDNIHYIESSIRADNESDVEKDVLALFDADNPLPATIGIKPKMDYASQGGMAHRKRNIGT